MFWCSRTLKEHLELEGSKVSQEFQVSSPHTTLHSTEPVKDFIVEGAQLKAGKENLLSITVPACIWQETPCKNQQQTAIWRAKHIFKWKRACSSLARLITYFRDLHLQTEILSRPNHPDLEGWNVREEFSYSWRNTLDFGITPTRVVSLQICAKKSQKIYTKIIQIPHHICKPILNLHYLN